MTAEEIKQAFSMREVVERYNIKIKRGMCCCPFHGEKRPSMKIYKDSYHCFACGANGDIFSFIQNMDNCDFKTAFYSLGGTYDKQSASTKMAVYHIQKGKEQRSIDEQKRRHKLDGYISDIHKYRELYLSAKPASYEFWDYLDKFHMALIYAENMEGGGKM